MTENRRKTGILYVLFFFSGLTSLVYESLWIRQLAIAYGSTTLSISLVLAFFFLGLASGSLYASRIVDRLQSPLAVYGILEGLIGLGSLVSFYLMENLADVFSIFLTSQSSPAAILTSKILMTGVLVTPISFAMGMTFPLLVKSLRSKELNVGVTVAGLYGINTLGALVGVLAFGLLLLPWMGSMAANHLMVAINFVLFGVCRHRAVGEFFSPSHHFRETPSAFVNPQPKLLLPLAAVVTGFVAMGSEVIWNKYLNLFLGNNIIGTSMTLAIFLLGVGLGSLLMQNFAFKKGSSELFLFLLSLSAIVIVFASSLLNHLPAIAHGAHDLLLWTPLASKVLTASLVLFFPTCLFGMIFPLLVHLQSTDGLSGARASGRIYSYNTFGGILGSFLVGLYLIPQWGSSHSLFILVSVQLVFVFVWIATQLNLSMIFWRSLTYFTLASLCIVFTPRLSWLSLIRATEYSYLNPQATRAELREYLQSSFYDLRFWEEGENAIVSLHYQIDAQGEMDTQKLILKSNGLRESFFDLQNPAVMPRYEALLGLLPYFYQNNPQTAFVVGFGGGYTAEILSGFNLRNIEVAEIEKAIIEANRSVYLGSNPLLTRSNLKIVYEDARFLLSLSEPKSFDIIVSQPSHSWMSGTSHLFTRDFFALVQEKLKLGGVFSQWLNLYNMDAESLKSLLLTFFDVFPHGAVFSRPGDDQLILIGSPSPLHLQTKPMQTVGRDEFWQERLVHLPVSSELDFFNYYAMNRQQALSVARESTLNTDRNALAEFRQSRLFYDLKDPSIPLQDFLSEIFLNRAQK